VGGSSGKDDACAKDRRETSRARLLLADPALGRDVPATERDAATEAAVAATLEVPPGPFALAARRAPGQGHLGFLVLGGVAIREIVVGEIAAAEILVPGDLFQPARSFGHGAADGWVESRWRTVEHMRVAVLDHAFASRIAPWPQLTSALLNRALERTDSQVFLSAVRMARRIEDRVWLALWHLSARHGDPAVRQIKISGQVLASVVGARRQSVSTALGQLADKGAVRRYANGALAVLAEPPELRALRVHEPVPVQTGRRAGDR
jgi:CRP/FNR family transcriptional regulator, cyclic AMP receptor protein